MRIVLAVDVVVVMAVAVAPAAVGRGSKGMEDGWKERFKGVTRCDRRMMIGGGAKVCEG